VSAVRGDFDQVHAASEQWMRAWIEQDRATLEKLLAPDYALVIATAPDHRFDRAAWLELAVGAYVCTRFQYEHVQLRRIVDGVIVMSAIADFDATMDGADRSGRFFVTDVWRRANGGWQVCARYSSPPSETDPTVASMIREGSDD
jgi:ketosteroid isomerase-like protein